MIGFTRAASPWLVPMLVIVLTSSLETGAFGASGVPVLTSVGVGLVMCLATRGKRGVVAAVSGGALATLVGAMATGASASGVATSTVGWLVVPLSFVGLRWYGPQIIGNGGLGSVHDVATLVRGVAVVTGASCLVAVVRGAAATVSGEPPAPMDVLAQSAGLLSGILVGAGSGHLVLEAWRCRALPRPGHGGPVALRAALAGSVAFASVSAAFVQDGRPLAFLAFPVTAAVAVYVRTWAAALYTSILAESVALLTVWGRGPFDQLADSAQHVTVQTFALTLMMTTLMIAASRDERRQLTSDLVQAHRDTAAQLELLDAVTNALTEGVAVRDTDGRILRLNPAATQLLSSTAEGVRENVHDYTLFRTDGAALDDDDMPAARAISTSTAVTADVVVRRADGSERTLTVTATPLYLADEGLEPAGAVSVYRDVTDERQQSQRLIDFAATAAHDLRSPLTAARGWLDVALMRRADPPVPSLEGIFESIERARRSTERMDALVTDLLSQAVAESSSLTMQTLSPPEWRRLVDEVARLVGLDDVSHEGAVTLGADRDLVRQLLLNLLGNAVKYTAADATPRVVVRGRLEGDRVVIDLVDNGIGVPVGSEDSVFERFARAHADDPSYTGTGLGLAICRTIVERHGGAISCRRNDEKACGQPVGSTFSFDLPAVAAGD